MTAILADSNESKEGKARIVFNIGRCGNAAVETMGILVVFVGAPFVRGAFSQKNFALGAEYLVAAIYIIDPLGFTMRRIARIVYLAANTANSFACAIDVFVIVVGSTGFSADRAILLSTANSFPVVLSVTLCGLAALFAVIDMTRIWVAIVMFTVVVSKTVFGNCY